MDMAMFEKFYPKIYNYIYYRVLHKETTEDLTGDVFYKALAFTKEDVEQPSDVSSELSMDELEIVTGGDISGAGQSCFFIQVKHKGNWRADYGWHC